MSDETIRVGIIGAGGWAKYGHIPALQSLEEFRNRCGIEPQERTCESVK